MNIYIIFSCIEQLLKLQPLVTLYICPYVCPTLGVTHFMSTFITLNVDINHTKC